MKKILLLLIFISLISFTSCKKNDNNVNPPKEDDVKIEIVTSSVKDVYYTDEFNITSIKLNVTKNNETKEINLTPLMIENYPSIFSAGKITLTIKYEGKTLPLELNFIERETYTEGLSFSINKSNTAYLVSGYTGTEKEVIIPSVYNLLPVEEIKSYAFNNNEVIEKVVLPDSIKKIGDNSFKSCINLSNINTPKNLVEISSGAFYDCINLNSFTLPKEVKSIGDYALTSIKVCYTSYTELPKNWLENAFDEKKVFIYYNQDLSKIKNYNDTFEYTIIDNKVTILSYLKHNLETVTVPDTIENMPVYTIGQAAFYYASGINEVILSKNLNKISQDAFRNSSLRKIEIPGSVKLIDVYAFGGCLDLEVVTFNDGLEILNRSAFAACDNLKEALLPQTVTNIESYVFQNCHKLERVYVPLSVKVMGEYVFYADSLNKIYYEGESIPSSWNPQFNPSRCKIIYQVKISDIK